MKPSPTFLLLLLVGILITINGVILIQAIQQAWLYYTPELKYASVFSAYYDSAWASIYNASHVYGIHNYPVPNSQDFRYPPWFLLFVLPFLTLPFPAAQTAFEVIQFLLLPIIALLVWKIIDPKSNLEFCITALVLFFTLLEPLRGTSLFIGFSEGVYFQQYWQGESKVLELFMILASLYAAKKGRWSWVAPLLLVLASFDPRFTLLALPLFAYFVFQSKKFRQLILGVILATTLVIPFAFYYDLLGQFTQHPRYKLLVFYEYEWVLFYPILALTLAILFLELYKKYSMHRHTRQAIVNQ